ncbi:MxaD family protein [Mycolicibacterium litorale]|nr:MxaD family protein [Mycolicibacterium litorale]
MVHLHVEKTIAAPPEQVFAWLADPVNIAAAPLVVTAGWAQVPAGPDTHAVRRVIAAGMWFREEITAYDPPRSYSYRIVRSVPAFHHEGGTLTFTPTAEGTHVEWVSDYTHPARGGGRLMEAVSSRLLPWNFRAILNGCAKALQR